MFIFSRTKGLGQTSASQQMFVAWLGNRKKSWWLGLVLCSAWTFSIAWFYEKKIMNSMTFLKYTTPQQNALEAF
jgi:hypothetical protein